MSAAVVPSLMARDGVTPLWKELLAIVGGSLLVGLLAHVAIPLPFTPVPITGQTFGVSLLALCWGRKRAVAAYLLYLVEGFSGLPVFASVAAGPTTGYLVGMLLATFVVGGLADRGYARTFRSAFACCLAGSVMTFSLGLFGLSFFVPKGMLLQAGLLPFIPGDLIKSALAAMIAVSASRAARPSS